MKFRIERTELHTRVWFIDADTEEKALEEYGEYEDSEEHEFYEGTPTVRIEVLPDTVTPTTWTCLHCHWHGHAPDSEHCPTCGHGLRLGHYTL